MLTVAIASLVLSRAVPSFSAAEVTLRFHPPVGAKYGFKMKMGMAMSFGPQAPAMNVDTVADVDMLVLSATGGVTTVQTKVKNAHVAVPPNSPISAMKDSMEKQIMGKPTLMKIDSRYHMTASLAGDSSLSNLEFLTFPEKPIHVGDTWGSQVDVTKVMGGMMSGKTPGMDMSGKIPLKFRLEKIGQGPRGKTATLSLVMKGSITMSMNGQKIPLSMDSKGTFMIDVATGMTVATSMSSSTSSNFGGGSMTQKMTQTMTLR